MTESQYRQTVQNRRPRQPRRLADFANSSGLLRTAARSLRKRDLAAQAWERIAEPDGFARTAIAGWNDGELAIVCGDEAIYERLRLRVRTITNELAAFVPGLRSVRFLRPEELEEPEPHRNEESYTGTKQTEPPKVDPVMIEPAKDKDQKNQDACNPSRRRKRPAQNV